MGRVSVYCHHTEDRGRLPQRLEQLGQSIAYMAIGMDLHMEYPHALQIIKGAGLRAYAHFLYYDVDEVVAQAARSLVQQGFDAVDLHALCGYETISRTCEAVRDEARILDRRAPLVVACALLPTQLDLPWRAMRPTTEESVAFAMERAQEALNAGVDGVLVPCQAADAAATVVPESKWLLVYADKTRPLASGHRWGVFYDWHLDEDGFWATDEGIDVIRSRGAHDA